MEVLKISQNLSKSIGQNILKNTTKNTKKERNIAQENKNARREDEYQLKLRLGKK